MTSSIHKNNRFIAILSILLLFAVIVYAFPALVLFLFQYILGNLLLGSGLVIFGYYFGARWAMGIAALFLVIYFTLTIRNRLEWGGTANYTEYTFGNFWKIPVVEGFSWSHKHVHDFLDFEKLTNPGYTFDMKIVQRQASTDELKILLDTGKWPWSDELIEMYKNALMTNNTVRLSPQVGVDAARSIYNENAAKQLLSWNSKEGTFLLTGATIGHTEGMPANLNNIVRCGNRKGSKKNVMEKISYLGYNSINGDKTKNVEVVENADIPKVVTGFSFLQGTCNPCVALNNPPNYSCPFSLDVGDGGDISPIWQNLWGDDGNNTKVEDDEAVKPESFPLLNQLADEIDAVNDLQSSS